MVDEFRDSPSSSSPIISLDFLRRWSVRTSHHQAYDIESGTVNWNPDSKNIKQDFEKVKIEVKLRLRFAIVAY